VLPDDYDTTAERLRDAGFEVEPREQHWGAPRAYVRGPGGHLVELMADRP
jgi:catechol 2,3-dioxygenase-like lactoylglutathione lyase family enzyme